MVFLQEQLRRESIALQRPAAWSQQDLAVVPLDLDACCSVPLLEQHFILHPGCEINRLVQLVVVGGIESIRDKRRSPKVLGRTRR